MKTVNSVIQDLEELKNKTGRDRLTSDDRALILRRKQSELKSKADQIKEEMQREVDDLFAYIYLKQASLETLGAMSVYIETEARKVGEELIKIGRPAREAKGA